MHVMSMVTMFFAAIGALCTLVLTVMMMFHRRWLRVHHKSRAVRGWKPGGGTRHMAGPLSARISGGVETAANSNHATLLLHGLATVGTYWGAAFDVCARQGSLVVPDLLGFGESVDPPLIAEQRSPAEHVAALEAMLDDLGMSSTPLTLSGHSVGGILALHHAATRAERDPSLVRQVVLFAPPLHDDHETAVRYVSTRGPFARYFAVDRRLARHTWNFLTARKRLAMALSRWVAPGLPRPVAEQSINNSWSSYMGTFRGLLGDPSWRACVAKLAQLQIPVTIAVGRRDTTVERRCYEGLPGVRLLEHHDGGHQLPLVAADWCVALLRGMPEPEATPLGALRPAYETV